MPVSHWERHRPKRIGWLRAAVLGANDGILSTASQLRTELNRAEAEISKAVADGRIETCKVGKTGLYFPGEMHLGDVRNRDVA